MKVVIYGAGSIGCYIGAILHQQGLNVCLLGRQRIFDTFAANGGVHLTDYQGRDDIVTSVPTAITPDCLQQADIVLVTLKCTAIDSAIQELAQHCGKKALVICMQNGVGVPEKVRAALPEHRIYAGITPFNVVQGEQAHFHRATEGSLHLPALPALKPLQGAWQRYGLGCELDDDIDAVIWGKLQLNLNNAINALSDIPLKAQLQQRGYRRVLAACQQELLTLCAKKGWKQAKLTAIAPQWLPTLLRLPDWIFSRIAQKMLAIDPQARSSMWEDVSTGRNTEIDYLNGAVARLSQEAGLQAPVNQAVADMIKQVERGELSIGVSASELLAKSQAFT